MHTKFSNSTRFALGISGIVTFGRFFSMPFLTLLLTSHHVNLFWVSLIISTPAVTSLIVSPLMAYVTGAFSSKRVMAISLFLMGIGFAGYAMTFMPLLLLLFSFLNGLGIAGYNPIVMTLLSDDDHSDSAMTLNYWLTNLAGALGPLFGAYIGGGTSGRAFLYFAVILLLIQIPINLMPFSIRTAQAEDSTIKHFFGKTFLHVFKNSYFIIIAAAYLCLFVVETQYDTAFGLHLNQLSPSAGSKYLAYMMTIMTCTLLMVQPILLWLNRHINGRIQLGLGWIFNLMGITFVVMSQNPLNFIIGSGITLGIGESFIGPKIQILIGKSVVASEKNIAFSMSTAFGNLGYFLGPIIGLNALSLGFPIYGLFLYATIGVMGLLLLFFIQERHNI